MNVPNSKIEEVRYLYWQVRLYNAEAKKFQKEALDGIRKTPEYNKRKHLVARFQSRLHGMEIVMDTLGIEWGKAPDYLDDEEYAIYQEALMY